MCPELPPPTEKAVDALEAAGNADPATAEWNTDLSQHYDALDTCNRERAAVELALQPRS